MISRTGSSTRGQALVLFTLCLVAIILAVGLVADGGYAFSQRRLGQNAADFAAMAGTRIVGEALTGQPPGAGTAANVQAAINSVLAANGTQLVSAQYVDASGAALGNVVGASVIPSGANGVVVTSSTNWKPFFLGIIGIDQWSADSTATALTPGSAGGGAVLPVGIQDSLFDGLQQCPLDDLNDCIDNFTSGSQNMPGGFGWLKFGLHGNGGACNWAVSLGMVDDGGCRPNQPFLDSEIGPPAISHGCCTAVGTPPGSVDLIGSLEGNKKSGDLKFYIDHRIPVWVPIWDQPGGNGNDSWYHIVGFGAVVFSGEDQKNQHAKWLEGAALDGVGCPGVGNAPVPGTHYCKGPGGAFTIGVTGEVRLVH